MSIATAASQPSKSTNVLIAAVRLYALTRIALGLWIFLDPSSFGHKWFTPPQDPVLTASLLKGTGGRDIGIALGLLTARAPRSWLVLCAFCDLLDAGVIILARSRFTAHDVASGAGGAASYAVVALILLAFTFRRKR